MTNELENEKLRYTLDKYGNFPVVFALDHHLHLLQKLLDMSRPTILYFAYGPNLVTARLIGFVPSAKPFKKAHLANYRLIFNKKSRDKSAQANVERADGKSVVGMLYSIDQAELSALNQAEKGYHRKKVTVTDDDGDEQQAWIYISKTTYADDDHRPFNWHKSLILTGAQEHGLVVERLTALTDSDTLFDQNLKRAITGLGVLPMVTLPAPPAPHTAIAVRFTSTISVNGGAGQTFFGTTKVGGNTVNMDFTVQTGDFLFISFVIKAPNGTNFTVTYSCENTATGAKFTDQDIPPHPSPVTETVRSGGQGGVQIKLIF